MKTSHPNPLPEPKRITVTTIMHIPELIGFWQESLDVFKLFISSLFAHTDQQFDLMVFDNGSCKEVHNYLVDQHHQGRIQYLFFSQFNLRKTRAMGILFREAPGEIIVFSDPDIFFLPGWLSGSLDILQAFPKAGMITAMPLASNAGSFYYQSTIKNATQDPSVNVTTGNNLIPEHFLKSHSVSIGVEYEKYIADRLSNRFDVKLSKDGISAYTTAVDFQFTTTREVLKEILPNWDQLSRELSQKQEKHLRGDQISIPIFELELDRLGYWKLSTEDYLVHHMGNGIPDLSAELPWMNPNTLRVNVPQSASFDSPIRKKDPIKSSTRVRNLIKKLHMFTYRWLYE